MSSCRPLVQERLSVNVVGDHLVSLRTTPGEKSVSEEFPLPDPALLRAYNMAMAEIAGMPAQAVGDVGQNYAGQVRSLSVALGRAVPMLARQRIAAAAGGLAAIELIVTADSLEGYPWELLGGPGALGAETGDVAVWRKVMSPPFRTAPWQRGGILLVGSEAMRAGSTYVHQELSMIASALPASSTGMVRQEPYLTISALATLLEECRPAVFHLAAHGTSEDVRVQNAPGPTLEELHISPEVLGDELRGSQVQVALLNCCDSASPPASGGRPAAYRIAARADMAVIGMAGKIQSHAAAVFASSVHRALASGKSAVQALFQGVCSIRSHQAYSMMWSLPVMYSRPSNVIPFPSTDEARARLSFQQAERHLTVLDDELAALADMGNCEPSEWALRTAIPAVRLDDIADHLPALAAAQPSATTDPTRQRHKLEQACEELAACLQASARTLSRLSDHDGQQEQQDPAWAELRLRRRELQRILHNLQRLFGDTA